MNYDHSPQKILIFGTSGSGKSTLFLQKLATFGADYTFVFDPELEAAEKLGWQAARTEPGLRQLLSKGQPVLYWPGEMFAADYAAGFAWFCDWTLAEIQRRGGRKLMAVDELQDFVDTGLFGLPPAFARLVNIGRRHGLDFLLAAQSANDVHHKVRRQLTEVFVFKHADTDTAGLRRLADMGFDPEAVKLLPYPATGHVGFIHRDFRTGKQERVGYAIDAA